MSFSFSKTLTIENKIFTKADIQYFWNKISENSETELILEFEDGTKCSRKNDEPLKDGDIIDQKKCKEITISYWDWQQKKKINFNLNNNRFSSYNRLEVEADDEHWFLGIFDKLKGKIDSVTDQSKWIRKLKYRISIALLCQTVTDFSLFFLLKIAFKSFLIDFIPGILGATVSISILFILPLIFPSIEFDFGPEDKKFAKIWRNRIKAVLIFILVGIILAIIIGLATNFYL